ncbi:zinc finger MYM-type protein 4-like [Amphibalanus amphitrite]|uniref:zinc finger MYM-type protein 4-like n=1 Tax=Amphibalanus amphitrite TaxID=1232801 RepID=UPI001C90ED15|nr:zinc finger MYM-type protein 4-like [Amphibalanus amphitrite]
MSAEDTGSGADSVAASPPAPTEDSMGSAEGSTAGSDRRGSAGSDSAADGPSTPAGGRTRSSDSGDSGASESAGPTAGGGAGSGQAAAGVATDVESVSDGAESDDATVGGEKANSGESGKANSGGSEKAKPGGDEVASDSADEVMEVPVEEGSAAAADREAEALTVEKEEPRLADDPHVTVIDIDVPADQPPKSSPLKQIRVISAATVSTLDESEEDGDDPEPVEATNGRSPPPAAGGTGPATAGSAKTGGSGGGGVRLNGQAAADSSNEGVTVVVDRSPHAAVGLPTSYGIVTPIYKDASEAAGGGKSLRPLAVRPAVVPAGTAMGATLLSSRHSKCIGCHWVKPIKYMMMANGAKSGNVICSDECLEQCVNNVKAGRMNIGSDGSTLSIPAVAAPPAASPATSLTVASVTSLSSPAVAAAATPASAAATPSTPSGGGGPTPAGDVPPGSSRSRTVCQNAACGLPILLNNTSQRLQRTVWETMVFCSPSCAVEHQKKDGSSCVFCKLDLPELVMGKYCVRFGSDVRQFCSNLCLDGFKKRLKVCSYCQRDITRFQGSFLAPVGSAGSHQFKEFCSQSCLTQYKTTHSEGGKKPPVQANCSVCLKNTIIEHKVAVRPDEPVKQLCSQICLKAYKFAIKDEGPLDTCAVCKSLLVTKNMTQFRVWNGSVAANLCSQSCSNVFVLCNRRIVSCRYCKVKKYNFDMMEITAEKDGLYCSVHCLKNCGKRIGPRTTTRTVSCAHCHTAMDSSALANTTNSQNIFCGTKCAMAFKKASRAAGSERTGDSQPVSNGVAPAAASAALPQIQSVISLADGAAAAPPAAGGAAPLAGTLPGVREHPSLVLMPPPPVFRRNVCVQVQPRKGEDKQTATVATQTDACGPIESGAVLPVPVPMYVPVPMMMYSRPVPVPVPLMLPVPVPLLCGAEDALRLLCGLPAVHRTAEYRQEGSPGRPVAGKRRRSAGSVSDDSGPEPELAYGSDGPGTPDSDADGSDSGSVDSAGRPPPHKRRKAGPRRPSPPSPSAVAVDGVAARVDLAALLRAPPTEPQARPGGPPEAGDGAAPQRTEFVGPVDESLPCHRSAIKYTWCVRVFEQFIRERNRRPLPVCDSDSAQSGTDSETHERLVADPLQATPSELAAGLRALVRELRRPGGEPYAPDLLHYLLLGIQVYLLEHRRWDSLFWGESYAEVGAALQERLEPLVEDISRAEADPRRHVLTTHVEERQLWEARVLGAHSPQSLVTTVIYFVTKYFLIGSLQWHQKLSFAMIQESINLKSRLKQSSLRLLDSRNVYKRSKTFEMPANQEDPFRCPVRFIEFYLSRCPAAERSSRSAPLYLTPAADGRPDGDAWFSSEPLAAEALRQVLSRLLTVRELQAALLGATGGDGS